MSVVTKKCWHCDRCGHEWLVQVVNKPPIFCSKCHQRNWNRDTKQPAPSSKVVHAIYTSRSGERSTTYCGRDIESVTTAGVDANDEVVLDGITCRLCLRHNEGHGGDDVRPLKSSTPSVQVVNKVIPDEIFAIKLTSTQRKEINEAIHFMGDTAEDDDLTPEEIGDCLNCGPSLRVGRTENWRAIVDILTVVLSDKAHTDYHDNNHHSTPYERTLTSLVEKIEVEVKSIECGSLRFEK